MQRPPKRFFLVAAAAGFAFSNLAVGVPLDVVAAHGTAAAAGDILAAATLAIAGGAAAAGRISARLRGGPRLLGAALATCATGGLLLAAAPGIAFLAPAAVVLGVGIGLFWVASQLILSRRAGEDGSAQDFLFHYAAYTGGGVLGSGLTGGAAAALAAAGLAGADGIRAAAALSALLAAAAAAAWRPCALPCDPGDAPRQARRVRTLSLQIPDLLLVGALALLLPLAPVVLSRDFKLDPLAVGLVTAGVALSKIAGTLTARVISSASSLRRSIVLLLAAGAAFCLLLATAFTLSLFVTLLLATALVTTGAWPLVVAGAQARVEPADRGSLTVRWNTREYLLIAAMTALSGSLLTAFGSAAPVFALAALLFALAAATAVAVLRPAVRAADAVV